MHSSGGLDAIHQYSALGPVYDSSSNAFEADYTVDSPMHSLSLASPSPPPEVAGRSGLIDVDMGEGDGTSSAVSHHSKTTFVPRQVKQTSLLRSTVPLVPSPLYHSHQLQSSSAASNSSGGHPTSSQSTSSEDSTAKKNTTISASDLQSRPCNSPASSQADTTAIPSNRTSSHHTSIKWRESPLQLARTPSPSPIPISPSSDHDDGRKLHYSPGLAQSAFPGGKHMLRYTMGYREDCVACQSKSESACLQSRSPQLIFALFFFSTRSLRPRLASLGMRCLA